MFSTMHQMTVCHVKEVTRSGKHKVPFSSVAHLSHEGAENCHLTLQTLHFLHFPACNFNFLFLLSEHRAVCSAIGGNCFKL